MGQPVVVVQLPPLTQQGSKSGQHSSSGFEQQTSYGLQVVVGPVVVVQDGSLGSQVVVVVVVLVVVVLVVVVLVVVVQAWSLGSQVVVVVVVLVVVVQDGSLGSQVVVVVHSGDEGFRQQGSKSGQHASDGL